MVGGHFGAGFDKGRSADDAVFTNAGPVDDHRAHAYQRVAPDGAAVQNRAVADMPLFFHDRILAGKAVHHAVILDVGAIFHHDAAKIAAQAGVRANVDPFAEDHVANQHRGGMNVALIRYHRRHTVNLINGHSLSLYACESAKALEIERSRRGKFPHRAFALLADKRQRAGGNALINIDAQLARGLPGPVRGEQLFGQQRVFQYHPAIEVNQ